jgi:hypothetical protein
LCCDDFHLSPLQIGSGLLTQEHVTTHRSRFGCWRHQAAADHQSEYDADTQERIAPVGQINAAQVCRPPLIDAEEEQPGIGRDGGTTKLQYQTAVKIEPDGL